MKEIHGGENGYFLSRIFGGNNYWNYFDSFRFSNQLYFYRLQKRDSISVYQEKQNHAIEELRDVIEGYVINQKDLSCENIDNLIEASERINNINLDSTFSTISILQDVSFRLQKSKHLDIEQKLSYSQLINSTISDRKQSREPIPTSLEENFALIKEVEKAIKEEYEKNRTLRTLKELENSMKRLRPPKTSTENGQKYSKFIRYFTQILSSVAMYTSLLNLFDIRDNQTRLFLISILVLISAIAILIISSSFRNKLLIGKRDKK